MATQLLSILTFPQKYENGQLYLNILVVPRNINPLNPLQNNRPAFVDGNISFRTNLIDSLDGPPVVTNVTSTLSANRVSDNSTVREVWEALQKQIELTEKVKVQDAASADPDQQFESDFEKYKNVSIRKHLPISYRKSFNFTKARTKYAVMGDEYECAVKNKKPQITDVPTYRDTISWGKLVAYCLRNPKLAEKAGLIYKVSIELNQNEFEKGGWVFADFSADSDFFGVETLSYAARIPALKEIRERENEADRKRNIFSAVLFPILPNPSSFDGFDRIFAEAINYDDGFAKIVHARQPINQDFLQETDKSNPPQMDFGIQLGWDDEQIPIWYNRQMLRKEETSNQPIDSPLGVFAYSVDVRQSGDDTWKSQNRVVANTDILVNGEVLILERKEELEMGTEIHPVSHGNSKNEGFWIPMYYTNWIGNALSIPDKEGQEISIPEISTSHILNSTENAQKYLPKPTFHPYSQESSEKVDLRYGNDYQFRVRMMDITGGTPETIDEPLNGGKKNVAEIHFKRHIAAGAMDILNVKKAYESQEFTGVDIPVREVDTSVLENIVNKNNPILRLKRPLLSYPSVVFTGKYSNAIQDLKSILQNLNPDEIIPTEIGLHDPDVDYFKIRVELKTLEMDNVLSENGKEPYVLLYEKKFQLENATDDFGQIYDLKIVYQDDAQISYSSGFDFDAADDELVLPTARNIRLSIIPIISKADNDYADDSVLEGKITYLTSFKASKDERNLLSPISGGIRGFYMQPDNDFTLINTNKVSAFENSVHVLQQAKTSVELSKIANELGLVAKNLTLIGEKGYRVQFGCSKEIRHSMAPDSSSVTLSENSELFNQWLNVLDFSIQRDWAWDVLKVQSVYIYRSVKNEDDEDFQDETLAGTIRIMDTANIQYLQGKVNRDHTRIVFLDAVDPKKINKKFPDEILVKYRIELNFKNEFDEALKDPDFEETLHLPITIIPQQVPKLVSAGVALSPYTYDTEKYSYSNSRQKFLWLEFEKPPLNPDDTYFVRVLNHAPDPLICRINAELINFENQDMPFNLADEKMRMIIPKMNNDYAGIGAMQEMIPEDTDGNSGNIFMVPLPSGMHASSDELFGFFTYEIRVGHKKESWSTAQARYGRPLKVNSVQHPAPELICNVYRNEVVKTEVFTLNGRPIKNKIRIKQLMISAPFANAVLNGKNVAAFPPQTSLWYLLYTQVQQADGKSYRNLLIDSGNMPYEVREKDKPTKYMGKFEKEDGTRYGVAKVLTSEIREKLKKLNLPANSPLSVVAVEMFPMDNNWQYLPGKGRELESNNHLDDYFVREFRDKKLVNPLTEKLGSYRIYRSSPLVPIDDICCDDC